MIEIRNLTKTYKTKANKYIALNNVNLSLPNVGLVTIYGENGCGKTTLLNMISSMDSPTFGEVLYNGIAYSGNETIIRKSIISVTLQDDYFIDYLNVYENLTLLTNEEVDDHLEEFNILDKKYEQPINLSGGQRQRVSLIKSFVKKSKVVIVDEPTSDLDYKTELNVFKKLKEISKTKLVLMVSHNVDLIHQFSDQLIELKNGQIVNVTNGSIKNRIHINDEKVLLMDDDLYLLSDWKIVKGELTSKRRLELSFIDSKTKDEIDFDYIYVYKPLEKDLNKIEPKKMFNLILKFFKAKLFSFVFIAFAISFILIFLTVFLEFKEYDSDSFIYNTLTENNYTYINFKKDDTVYENYEKSEFTLDDFIMLNEIYQAKPAILLDLENMPRISGNQNPFYTPNIYGYNFIYKDNVKMVVGNLFDNDSILITDFTADYLILLKQVNDYNELLNYKLNIGKASFTISGIIDTDYEKYLDLGEDFESSNKYVDFQNDVMSHYSRFYFNFEYFNKNLHVIYNYPISDELTFANVYKATKTNLPIEFTSENGVFINEYTNSFLKEDLYIKFKSRGLNILGVVNDGKEEVNIYADDFSFEYLKYDLFAFESINLEVNSLEVLKFLIDKDMVHNTSISSLIRETIDIINMLNSIYMFLIVFVFIMLISFIIFKTNIIISRDNILISNLIMGGVEKKQILILELFKSGLMSILIFIIFIPLFLIITYVVNFYTSNLNNIDISILYFPGRIVFINFIAVLFISLIVMSVKMLRIFKIPVIKLIKKY